MALHNSLGDVETESNASSIILGHLQKPHEHGFQQMLGLSVATLRAWRHRGRGPRFLRLGRSVRYLPSDLADFVRASAVDTTSVSSSDGESEIGELPL
jgi:hypothetical protein